MGKAVSFLPPRIAEGFLHTKKPPDFSGGPQRKTNLSKYHSYLFFLILSARDGPDNPGSLMHGFQSIHGFFRNLAGYDKNIPDAAIENLKHFRPGQASLLAQPVKYGLNIPGIELDLRNYGIG